MPAGIHRERVKKSGYVPTIKASVRGLSSQDKLPRGKKAMKRFKGIPKPPSPPSLFKR